MWCFERLFVKAPSGRPRVNVLTALHAITHEGFTVQNPTYITAETACALLRLLAGTQLGVPISIILDNARDRLCALVQTVAQELDIELLYLPTYSPNLHLIERLWKFIKKPCLYSKYYLDSESFQQATMECIEQAPTTHQEELKRLLALRFQAFQEVPVIGEQQTISKTSPKKVLCKAA